MKKGIRKSISVLILVLGLIFSVSSLLVSNNVKAANYSYKDYQLYDHNSITGKVTPYTIHYRNSSKKLKYFGDANCNSKLASADKAHRRKGSWEFQVDQD